MRRFVRAGRNEAARRQRRFSGWGGNKKLPKRMMLADRAIVLVVTVMLAPVAGRQHTVGSRTNLRRGDHCHLGVSQFAIIIVFQPTVQSLAEYGNQAVTGKRQSNCKTMEHAELPLLGERAKGQRGCTCNWL
jgi:hypothetical protein